jgi:hypothetical protein
VLQSLRCSTLYYHHPLPPILLSSLLPFHRSALVLILTTRVLRHKEKRCVARSFRCFYPSSLVVTPILPSLATYSVVFSPPFPQERVCLNADNPRVKTQREAVCGKTHRPFCSSLSSLKHAGNSRPCNLSATRSGKPYFGIFFRCVTVLASWSAIIGSYCQALILHRYNHGVVSKVLLYLCFTGTQAVVANSNLYDQGWLSSSGP